MPDQQPELPPNVVPFPGTDRGDLMSRPLADAGMPVAGDAGSGHRFLDDLPQRAQPELLPRPGKPRQFTVRVDLDDVEPPIWRRLVLAGDLTLDRLHEVLQAAMGWTDSHLHQFKMGPVGKDFRIEPFLTDFAESEGEEGIHEREVRLDEVVAEPGHRLFYEYDFGDGWDHTIEVESVDALEPDRPPARCTGGERACPPEDVGGIPGYQEVLDALADPGPPDEWMAEKLGWLPPGFDPAELDVSAVDDVVRRVAAGGSRSGLPPMDSLAEGLRRFVAKLDDGGAAYVATWLGAGALDEVELDEAAALAITAPWRTLLATVGDGLKLTGAGYLPPATVVDLLAILPLRGSTLTKGNREEYVRPVAGLRESATRLGLVRKAHGRLYVTATGKKLAEDPVGLVHHIARRLPTGRRDHETDAGWVTLVRVAAGADDPYPYPLSGRVLGGIGWRVHGQLPSHHVGRWAADTSSVLSLAGWNPDRYDDLRHDPRARMLAQLAVRA